VQLAGAAGNAAEAVQKKWRKELAARKAAEK
jgi:hypothetical protein